MATWAAIAAREKEEEENTIDLRRRQLECLLEPIGAGRRGVRKGADDRKGPRE